VQAVLAHTALQLVVSSSGLARLPIGFMQGEQSMCREERIRPALMVTACPPKAGAFLPLAQERPQPTTDEAIDRTKDRKSRVFE
jgi:hypothetical protein